MLSVNNIKLITFVKHSTWKICIDNTYCRLKTRRNRYKLVQAFNYSTKCDTKKNKVQSSFDPRVEALRKKLIYCDYLDYQKVKVSYMKRFLLKKKAENAERRAQIDKLTNVPVYSVLLDTRNDENDDSHLQQEHINTEEDVAKPVHMPYASIDSYSNVDTSSFEANKNNLDENTISLNNKYKALYEKYLAKKNADLEKERVTLQDYLKEIDTDASYKRNFSSNVPSNWMVDVEQYDDALQDNIWLNNYGTPDPNSNVSSVPCGGCGALLHCKDQALPGYLPSELFLKRSEQELRIMVCQRCHFIQHDSCIFYSL